MLWRLPMAFAAAVLMALPVAAQDLLQGTGPPGRDGRLTTLLELLPRAAGGDAWAQNSVGLMFFKGEGVPRDDAEAAAWFRGAAAQGHAGAQHNLALMYLRGRGVPRDRAQAAAWFGRAAAQGHARARYNLALMHLRGDGAPRDEARAAALLRAAAAQGHPDAGRILRSMRGQGPAQAAPPPAAPPQAAPPPADPPPDWAEEAGETVEEPGPAAVAGPAPLATADAGGTPGPTAHDGPAPETGTPPAAAPGAFAVQLGSVRTEEVAAREAERLNRVHRPLLGALTVAPVRADLGERGVYFRLRTTPLTGRDAARALCRDLAARDQGCIVVRP